MLFTFIAIGQSNYFGFGFTTLNWKPLYNAIYKVNKRCCCLQIYADMLEKQQKEGKDFGSHMSEDYMSNTSEEQLYQLYTLHQEINDPSESSDSTKKS